MKKLIIMNGCGGSGKDTFVKSLTEKGVTLENNPRLMVKEYIDNMDVCMAAADLIISRSGANALCEIESVGRASILIPSPIVAGNHQYHNAMVLANAGAAVVFEQKDLTSELLIKTVDELYHDPDRLAELSKNAAALAISDTPDRIYRVISGLIDK